jgi:hypothetical protein
MKAIRKETTHERRKQEQTIKINLKLTLCEDTDCIQAARKATQWRVILNTVVHLQVL